MNGIILIDKPTGLTSFGVVNHVRYILSRQAGKKIKVGHTGTLDPFATGLLILVVGLYCKRANEFSKSDKTYEATMIFGQVSSTGDPEGEISSVDGHEPARSEIESVLARFRGAIEQTPPAHSAIKINGQRAYKLARIGQEVEMPKRMVHIKRLELTDYSYPEAKIVCEVSSGTYIRSLVEDIGRALGVGAYTTQLRRTRVGEYSVSAASPIDAPQVLNPDSAL